MRDKTTILRVGVAGVDHPGAIFNSISIGGGNFEKITIPTCIQPFKGHEVDQPVNAAYAFIIAPLRPDNAGNVGAVTFLVIILGLVILIDKIPAVDIVNIAVVIIVDPVGFLVAPFSIQTDFAEILPQIIDQIGMVQVDPGINGGNHKAWIAGADLPGVSCVDIRIWQPSHRPLITMNRLPHILQRPLKEKGRIIGLKGIMHPVVGFGVKDIGMSAHSI